ncbi:MAG: HD domain-containing protein [Chloroflexi bacterium]|nr:HD domain-containing protein [Chloroflexota bacterium]
MGVLEAVWRGVPPEVRAATDLLRRWGVPAWLVGGAVRDLLLERPTHDFDIAVEGNGLALARRVADALHRPFVSLDAERGFGRVMVPQADALPLAIDFAQLVGGSLPADLAQRDFTFNAMALDLGGAEQAVIDPHGGVEDLRRGVVRVVSAEAFPQDPLRLLRAVRFRAELGFAVEPHTESLMAEWAEHIRGVAWERVRDEMCRILEPDGAAEALAYLHRLGLLAPLFPEVAALEGVSQSPPHWQDVLRHSFGAVAAWEALQGALSGRPLAGDEPWGQASAEAAVGLAHLGEPIAAHLAEPLGHERSRRLLLKWAALLHDVGKPRARRVKDDGRITFYGHDAEGGPMAAGVATRLRFTRREVAALGTVVRLHMRPALLANEPTVTRRAVFRFFDEAGPHGVDVALLSLADRLATWGAQPWTRRLEVVRRLLESYYLQRELVVAPPKLLSGHDLLALGVPSGPEVGRLLQRLREAQAEGLVTTREAAVEWVRAGVEGGMEERAGHERM